METTLLLQALIGIFMMCSSIQAKPITYNQRQTGDVNLQVHLKDVAVVAVVNDGILDDYVEYDYDYSQFTSKPTVKPTPITPSTTSWPTNSPSTSSSPIEIIPTTAPPSDTSEVEQDGLSTSTLAVDNSQISSTTMPSTTVKETVLVVKRRDVTSARDSSDDCGDGLFNLRWLCKSLERNKRDPPGLMPNIPIHVLSLHH